VCWLGQSLPGGLQKARESHPFRPCFLFLLFDPADAGDGSSAIPSRMSLSLVPFVLFRALNENGFLLLKRLPSPGNRGLQLTCLNAALYTVYSRWA
jgi:hypothetical protein